MLLSLTTEQYQLMQTHAEQAYPQECCGVLLGRREPQSMKRTLVTVWPTENAWQPEIETELQGTPAPIADLTQERRYWIDPAVLLQVHKTARQRQLEMIGIYHSHPNHSAVPSEYDRTYAWPDYSYIIISVKPVRGQGQELGISQLLSKPLGSGIEQEWATTVRSWRLDANHQFQAEVLTLISEETGVPSPA